MEAKAKSSASRTIEHGSLAVSVIVLITLVLVCIAVPIILSRALPATPSIKPSAPSAQTPVTPDPSGRDTTPVFAGATVMRPVANADTATVTDQIDSRYGVIVDAQTGAILAGKNADERFHIASMTKIMTLIVACERLQTWELGMELSFTSEINAFVRPSDKTDPYYNSDCHWSDIGDGATLLEQLYGIGVESAADCAVMVATYLVGSSPDVSEAQFVAWMNEKATEMGLANTHFDNLVGNEGATHYSTANDVATMLLYALKSPLITDILSTKYRAFEMFGYNSAGEFVRVNGYYYSTLFNANPQSSSRELAYQNKYGKFSLSALTLEGGKTGSLKVDSTWLYSLASFAKDRSGNRYIVVTGETVIGSEVLRDAKYLYDTYGK